ncbi:hypothetical protein [Dehalococcoides mccartyi]|uniref:hypothetical protein n=1 Tax=Dehalococcoides mccartyi TaxID=61435 RepID=UPI0026F1D3B4|nr:hypothetical protein [Dehalococcoides mccartyi]
MMMGALTVFIVRPEYLLHLDKSGFVNQCRLLSFNRDVTYLQPGFTQIEAMMENITPFTGCNPVAQIAPVTQRIGMFRPLGQGPFPGSHFFKGFSHKRTILRINLNPCFFPIPLIEISKGSFPGPAAIFY